MTQFERTFNFMKQPWVILAYIVLLIVAYNFLDKPLAIFFHEFDFRTHMHLLNFLTAFGQAIVYLSLFFVAAVFFRYVKPHPVYEARAWYLLSCVFIANVCCFIIKISLSRARPDLLFQSDAFGFYWFQLKDVYWSCPSGHTVTIISLVAGLGVLFPKHFFALLGLALLVVLSRVLLYKHYLSDVMSGFYLSILIVGLLTQYLQKKNYLSKAGLKWR